jgi:hypothetical protein
MGSRLVSNQKAGIYPPGASAALVSDGASNRSSRRIKKLEASKELQRIANDKTLSTDQVITQSSVVLEDVMELSKYEQLPPEKLCPPKRQKKRNKQGSISPSQSQSPLRHAYQNVTGNFSPRAMLEISDSFAAEREEWSKVRQFVCTVEGCKFGLKSAPSRFSREGYLRSHMKQKHGESGIVRPGFENAVVDSPAPIAPTAAKLKQSVEGSSKIRKCSLCSQTGHDRRKCPGVELTPIHSPAGTPATKQNSPSPFQPTCFPTPSPFRHQWHEQNEPAIREPHEQTNEPAKIESREQTNEPAKRSCSVQ